MPVGSSPLRSLFSIPSYQKSDPNFFQPYTWLTHHREDTLMLSQQLNFERNVRKHNLHNTKLLGDF
jgi:hypothetical protein